MIVVLLAMPFTDKVGNIFNCGFCRTLVYEHCTKITEGHNSAGKVEDASATKKAVTKKSSKPVLSFTEMFKQRFSGPRFVVGNNYFEPGNLRGSLFERHVGVVIKSFWQKFFPTTEAGLREKYLATFSSSNWDKLTSAEKAAHSRSNCEACAQNFLREQKSFPLKPTFFLPEKVSAKSFIENDYKAFNNLCEQKTGQPFADLANKYPQRLGLRDTDAELKSTEKSVLHESVKQCDASILKSSLVAAYTHDVSLNKMDKIRKVQYFNPPKPADSPKTRFAVKPSECSRYDELVARLKSWDSSCPFVAT